MSLKGATHNLLTDKGGLQFPENIDVMDETGMLEPTKNISFNRGGRSRRKGTSLVFATALGGKIWGVMPYTKVSGTSYVISATASGNLAQDTSTNIATGLTITKPYCGETFEDILYLTSPQNRIKTWAGSGSAVNLTTIPTAWGTTVGPAQLFKRSNVNSVRLVAVGVPGLEQNVYISAADSDDLSDANVVVLAIESGDAGGILGGTEFGERLLVFSRNHTYIIDDSSTTVANWSYQEAQWLGGAGSWRLIVRTPNDLHIMNAEGDIYSIITAQQFGDYKTASLTRPAFINRWIEQNVDIAAIPTDCHGVYDPELRAVKWFVKRKWATEVDTCLVYFIDRPPAEAWVIHDNLTSEIGYSGYQASSSAYGRVPPTGQWKVMAGNWYGTLLYLESDEAAYSDNGTSYYSQWSTAHLHGGNPRSIKVYKYGHLVVQASGACNLAVDVWIDGKYRLTKLVDVSARATAETYTVASFPINAIGSRIQYRVYSSTIGQNFIVSRVMTDFKELGTRTILPFDTEDLSMQLIDEKSGSSTTAISTTGDELILLSSMTVAIGDRILLLYSSDNVGGAATTRIFLNVDQSSGTGVGTWFVAGGPAMTSDPIVSQQHTHTSSRYAVAAAVWAYVTTAGTMVLRLTGQTVGANATSGTHRLTAIQFRP
jgi:hypothetical protein